MLRKKLLSLNFFPNFLPPRTGGEQRSFFLLKALAKDFDIISVVPTYENMRTEEIILAPGLTEVRIPKSKSFAGISAELRKKNIPIHQTAMAYALAGASQPELISYLTDLWPQIDGVVLQHASAVAVLDAVNLEAKPTFYISHNCEFELAANAHIDTDDHEFAILMHQMEYRACLGAQIIAPTTDEDREKYVHLYGAKRENIHVAGNGSVCRYQGKDIPNGTPSCQNVLFMGSKWGPNLKAGQFICSEIAPVCPDLTFHLCGNVCEDLTSSSIPSNVVLHGVLSDVKLANLMGQCHIGLNPILDGAGSNVKLADYLAHGLRVVTTPKGMRGFEAELENLHCAEPHELADMLKLLCAQPSPDQATRAEWQAKSADLWSWDHIGAQLSQKISQSFNAKQDASAPPRRIVVLNEFPITGRESGGEARISGLLSEVPDNTEVVIVSFGRGNFVLHQLAERLSCIELPATTWQKAEVAQANRYNYTSVDDVVYPQTAYRNPMFLSALDCMVAHADAVVLEHPFMWEVYRQLRSRAPIIFGSHNVEADMKLVTLDAHKRKHYFCDIIRDWEQQVVQHANLVCACSPQDAATYKSWGAQKVEILENGVTPLEEQQDKASFEPERSIYLSKEFTELSDKNLDQVYQNILKRPPSAEELKECRKAHKTGQIGFEKLLLRLVRSEENLEGPRSYVTGLLTNQSQRPFSAVFLGTSHRPNLSAAELLITFVAPACPDIDFLLVGKVGRSLGNRSLPNNVFVTGFVSDALKTAVMMDCDLGLNPMTEGGGSNLKIPDYLAHGLAVVSTYFGGRGFRFSPKEGLHLADILGFSAKINELEKSKGDTRTRLETTTGRIQEYYWSNLSKRYYELIAQAANFWDKKKALLLQSSISLDPAMFASAISSMEQGTSSKTNHILVQAPPLIPSPDAPRYHAFSDTRLSYFEHRRELYVNMNGLPSYGMFRKRVTQKSGVILPDISMPHRPHELVRFNEKCSAPLFNGYKVHRFLGNGAQIGLPSDCQTVYINGYAPHPLILGIYADGQQIDRKNLHQKFSLKIQTNGATEVDFSISGSTTFGNLLMSLEGMSIRCGSMAYSIDLLQPDFLADCHTLDGHHQTKGLQEDRALNTILACTLPTSVETQAFGNKAFVESIRESFPSTQAHPQQEPVIEDWTIGLMSNERNRVGYRNKLNLGEKPLVVITEKLESALIALIEKTMERLKNRFPKMKCIVLVPKGIEHTQAVMELRDYFAKKKIDVTCSSSESPRETLSLMAESGVTLAYRTEGFQQKYLSLLNEVFDLNIRFWGGSESIQHSQRAIRILDEIIHAYWQGASNIDWHPSVRLDLLKTPQNVMTKETVSKEVL